MRLDLQTYSQIDESSDDDGERETKGNEARVATPARTHTGPHHNIRLRSAPCHLLTTLSDFSHTLDYTQSSPLQLAPRNIGIMTRHLQAVRYGYFYNALLLV